MQIIAQILKSDASRIVDLWLDRLKVEQDSKPSPAVRVELADLIVRLADYFAAGTKEDAAVHFRSAEDLAASISASHARDGFSPMDAARLFLPLKAVVGDLLIGDHPSHGASETVLLRRFDGAIDLLALASFAAYAGERERLIERQSRALLDLATPALPIWRHVVLMPLVGIVDTQRARQITERLLDALTRDEAFVAILDVTGVPIIDSRVALHLTKTVEAARLLGAEVVLSGISPDAAQTLVKLDVDLRHMITRGTLRAGLAEAFRLVRRAVGAQNELEAI